MKYFFDTSSLVKIYHPEDGTKEALDLYLGDAPILISDLSRIEFLSTIYRKYREREINSDTLDALLLRFQEDVEGRYELLEFSSLVLEDATRLLSKYGEAHSLKTLDSLQFAFFTTYADKEDVFVCSDLSLATVVRLEGGAVYVPKGSLPEHGGGVPKKPARRTLFLSPPHMGGEELNLIREAFESNYIAPLGPMVNAFEKEFAEYTGIGHCAAVSSGTAAMHLALRCLAVGPGDEVFASTLTFIGSVTSITFEGATPVFIDSDYATWTMDPNLLEQELKRCSEVGKLPKAVVPTDLYGQCCDYDRIFDVCDRYGVPVVLDSAEAIGAKYLTQRRKGAESELSNSMPHAPSSMPEVGGFIHAGKEARAAVFSFNGNKIITTSGGGMLASDDKELIDYARFLSQQARDPFVHYEHSTIGYNYRMSNVLAAIGRGQLKVVEERVKKRRDIFEHYKKALSDLPGIEFMPEAAYGKSNRWLTVILISPQEFGADREEVRLALEKESIEARPVWKPMHMQPVFNSREQRALRLSSGSATGSKEQKYASRVVGGEVAEDLFNRGLCLPSGTAITDSDLDRVIAIIRRCLK